MFIALPKICPVINILSVVDLFGRIPIDVLPIFPTTSDNHLFSNIVNILYAILCSVIGLYLLQSNLSPVL
jgi:hypothetical protein